jgi:hypothetical protein
MRPATSRILLVSLAAALLASAAFPQPRDRWAPFGPGGGTPRGLADGGVTLTPFGPPSDAAKRALVPLLTDLNHPGALWAVTVPGGGLSWGRFE